MVYYVFRSNDGNKRFEMGTLIVLENIGDEDKVNRARYHVTSTIRSWSPEDRWNNFFEEDDTPKCVIFFFEDLKISTAYCKLPNYEPEIFGLFEFNHDLQRDANYVLNEVHKKYS